MLCALDYALTDGVNTAIRDLVERRIAGAVSCLAVSDLWPKSAMMLSQLKLSGQGSVQIGLSLRLTGAFAPLSTGFSPENSDKEGYLPQMKDLAASARSFSLDEKVLEAELRAQIRRFTAHAGVAPTFVTLDAAMMSFGAASLAVTAALRHFKMQTTPVICPYVAHSPKWTKRLMRKYLWQTELNRQQKWNRRHLIPPPNAQRLPPRSSWLQDGQIWTAISPASDIARLDRFDDDPQLRVESYGWFSSI